MELKTQQFDSHLRNQLRNILEYNQKFKNKLSYFNPADKTATDRILIQLLHSIQNISKIIFPRISGGQFFGLPKEATDANDEPDVMIFDKENPSWDFRPWFFEKFNHVINSSENLLETYEIDITHLTLAPNSGLAPIEFVVGKMERSISAIKTYSEAILAMLESGRLTVRDVRLEDEE